MVGAMGGPMGGVGGMGGMGRMGGMHNPYNQFMNHGPAGLVDSQSGLNMNQSVSGIVKDYFDIARRTNSSIIEGINYVRLAVNLPFYISRTVGPMLQNWSLEQFEKHSAALDKGFSPFSDSLIQKILKFDEDTSVTFRPSDHLIVTLGKIVAMIARFPIAVAFLLPPLVVGRALQVAETVVKPQFWFHLACMGLSVVPFALGTGLLAAGVLGGFASSGIFLDLDREAEATQKAYSDAMKQSNKEEAVTLPPNPKDYFDKNPNPDENELRKALENENNRLLHQAYVNYARIHHHDIYEAIKDIQ